MSDNYVSSTTNFKVTTDRAALDTFVYWDNEVNLADTVVFAFDAFDFMFYSKSASGFGGAEGWGVVLDGAPSPELFISPSGYLQTAVGLDQIAAAQLDIGNLATSISLNKPTVVDSITAKTTNGNLQIGGDGTGVVELQSDITNSVASFSISETGGVGTFGGLEVVSTTNGIINARMTTGQRNAIAAPTGGLQIFNTTTSQFEGYNGSAWVILG
jgi:hypothetical protein